MASYIKMIISVEKGKPVKLMFTEVEAKNMDFTGLPFEDMIVENKTKGKGRG